MQVLRACYNPGLSIRDTPRTWHDPDLQSTWYGQTRYASLPAYDLSNACRQVAQCCYKTHQIEFCDRSRSRHNPDPANKQALRLTTVQRQLAYTQVINLATKHGVQSCKVDPHIAGCHVCHCVICKRSAAGRSTPPTLFRMQKGHHMNDSRSGSQLTAPHANSPPPIFERITLLCPEPAINQSNHSEKSILAKLAHRCTGVAGIYWTWRCCAENHYHQ